MDKKIKESIELNNIEVWTDNGWTDVKAIHKTVPYIVYEIGTKHTILKCADNHIVFTYRNKKQKNKTFVKDLKLGDNIFTEYGVEEIIHLKIHDYKEEMYDLELTENSNHRYYTNSILSHNTSLARILAEGRPTLTINASSEAKIEFLREQLTEFCSTRSIVNPNADVKVVFLDEFDGATKKFYDAFRPLMEKFSDNIRFIATCNYVNEIPIPVLSRFNHIQFYPLDEKEEQELTKLYYKRLSVVSKKYNLKWENKETLLFFIKKYFPDIRTMISKIQNFINSNIPEVTLEDVKKTAFSFVDLYELIANQPNPHENYKFIMAKYATKITDVFYSLGQEFPDWLSEYHPEKLMSLPQCLIYVADYEHKTRNSIDPTLGLLAVVFQLQKTLNG
jgi:DNA polymerase III delta prime subunit